jgi:hypothetical protein
VWSEAQLAAPETGGLSAVPAHRLPSRVVRVDVIQLAMSYHGLTANQKVPTPICPGTGRRWPQVIDAAGVVVEPTTSAACDGTSTPGDSAMPSQDE